MLYSRTYLPTYLPTYLCIYCCVTHTTYRKSERLQAVFFAINQMCIETIVYAYMLLNKLGMKW